MGWRGLGWRGRANSKPPKGAAQCSRAAPTSDAKSLYIILKQALLVYSRRASDSNPDQLPLVQDRWRCWVKAVHLLVGTWRVEGRKEEVWYFRGVEFLPICWDILSCASFKLQCMNPNKLKWWWWGGGSVQLCVKNLLGGRGAGKVLISTPVLRGWGVGGSSVDASHIQLSVLSNNVVAVKSYHRLNCRQRLSPAFGFMRSLDD